MIAPVSVCHQLSWIAWLNISLPQTTASGLSGSPTEEMNRNDDRSWFLTGSSPARISMRMAVGAVYQTVTLYLSIVSYQLLALNPPS